VVCSFITLHCRAPLLRSLKGYSKYLSKNVKQKTVSLEVHKLRVYKITLFIAVFAPNSINFPKMVEVKFFYWADQHHLKFPGPSNIVWIRTKQRSMLRQWKMWQFLWINNFDTRHFTTMCRMSKVEECQGLYILKFNWKLLEPFLRYP